MKSSNKAGQAVSKPPFKASKELSSTLEDRIMVKAKPTPPKSRRQGFTLLELLIVIVVVAILAAFIIPAVGAGITKAREAGVRSEISQLDSAIAKFKADHGIEPPSSIYLSETGANWDAASAATIRQIWPQYSFLDFDINGDGTIQTGLWTLTGSECLMFFLGGVNGNSAAASTAANNVAGNIGPCTGFSKDPTNPFIRGGTREAPLFEFQFGRFKDVDSDGFPEYVDSLPGQTSPYLYYSGYDSQGYNAAEFLNSSVAVPIVPTISYGIVQVYTQGKNATDPAWKPNSHQIISPGYDRQYGYGGPYIAAGSDPLPTTLTPSALVGQRAFEADNITNFATGRLRP